MKRNLLLCVCVFFVTLTASAQWNVQGGLNFSSTTADGVGTKVGYRIGVGYETSTAQTPWAFQTGLFFQSKGAKIESIKMTANYLEIPLYAAFNAKLNDKGTGLVFNAGPYLAYGVSGKTKADNLGEMDTFDDKTGLERFEAGLGFGAGVKFDTFTISVQYQFGLTKLMNVEGAAKNTNFGIVAKYSF